MKEGEVLPRWFYLYFYLSSVCFFGCVFFFFWGKTLKVWHFTSQWHFFGTIFLLSRQKKGLFWASKCLSGRVWRGKGPHGPETFPSEVKRLTESNIPEVVLMQSAAECDWEPRCQMATLLCTGFWLPHVTALAVFIIALRIGNQEKELLIGEPLSWLMLRIKSRVCSDYEAISRSSTGAVWRDSTVGGVTGAPSQQIIQLPLQAPFSTSTLLPNWEFATEQRCYSCRAGSLSFLRNDPLKLENARLQVAGLVAVAFLRSKSVSATRKKGGRDSFCLVKERIKRVSSVLWSLQREKWGKSWKGEEQMVRPEAKCSPP